MRQTNRRHSIDVINTGNDILEPERLKILETPRRRFSINNQNMNRFNNLRFGHYDEGGVHKMSAALDLSSEGDSAEFTGSEDRYSGELDGSVSEGDDSEPEEIAPEFQFLKRYMRTSYNDLVDFVSFKQAFQDLDMMFYGAQLVAVFKYVSPDKQPVPFTRFVTFFVQKCDDPILELYRKSMHQSLLKAFKTKKMVPDRDEVEKIEDIPIEMLRLKHAQQTLRIKELESALETSKNDSNVITERCKHLEKKVKLLEDGEKLQTHSFLVKAMIREGENVKSKRIRIMPEGATVRVAESKGNRARIDFPLHGWCSIYARDGRPILKAMDPEAQDDFERTVKPLLQRLVDTESECLSELTQGMIEEVKQKRPEIFTPTEEEKVFFPLEQSREEPRRAEAELRDLKTVLTELKRQKILLAQTTSAEIERLRRDLALLTCE